MTQSICTDDKPTCGHNASKLPLLHQLFAAATYDASAAMCCWTNNLITLTLDEVYEAPLADACLGLSLGDEQLTVVVLNMEGELGGTVLLTFTADHGRRLAASLLGATPSDSPEWNDMERSALAETGNILSGAYMNAITRLIHQPLVPSVPYCIQGDGASVLQQVLAARASDRTAVLICRTGFRCADENLSWQVLFLPTAPLRAAMENALPARR